MQYGKQVHARFARAAFVTVAVLGAVASAVTSRPAMAEESPLIIARNLAINSLDPARTSCDTCNIFMSVTYETLVRLGDDNKTIEPGVAEKWEANEDSTVFTFDLNPNAVFADGSPIEAKDVKWSWDRLVNLQSGMSWLFEDVKSIEIADVHTIIVTLVKPDSEFLGKVIAPYAGVVNSDLAAENGAKAEKSEAANDSAEPWFLANSAGSGPYILAGYSPDSELRFKRNDRYWKEGPAIGEIVFRQVKDSVAQAQALMSGAVDIAMEVAPDTAKTIAAPGLVVESVPAYQFLYMALSAGAKGNPPLSLPVRQAIGYAIDYQKLIEFTLGGAGQMVPVAIPNGFPGTEGLPAPEYNVQKAKDLLASAGFPDGFEMEALFPNENYYGVDMSTLMQFLQQELAKVNVRLQLKPVTFPVWLETVKGEGTPFTASFYSPDYFGSDQYIRVFAMYPGTRWHTRSGAERAKDVTNPREKELLDKAVASSADERDRIYHEIALEMIKDRVIIPLVSPNVVLAYNEKVEGMRYSVIQLIPLQELSFKK